MRVNAKSYSALQIDEQAERSNKISSDMHGSLSTSKGDFETSDQSGRARIPDIVQITPITTAALVLRALKCNGLQIA